MQQIDFTKQKKEAEREYKQNKNSVAGRLHQREKRVTKPVRLSVVNKRRLKMLSAKEDTTMSKLLDEILNHFFKKY